MDRIDLLSHGRTDIGELLDKVSVSSLRILNSFRCGFLKELLVKLNELIGVGFKLKKPTQFMTTLSEESHISLTIDDFAVTDFKFQIVGIDI